MLSDKEIDDLAKPYLMEFYHEFGPPSLAIHDDDTEDFARDVEKAVLSRVKDKI